MRPVPVASGSVCLAAALLVVVTSARGAPPRLALVPPLEGANVSTVAVERDGTRRLISSGMRVRVATNGEISVGDEVFESDKSLVTVELPPRFGGGFLFASSGMGRTPLWKAKTWSDELVPFADIDFEVSRIVPGFDRIYLQARRSGEWAALDPDTGAGLDRGALPPSPNYGTMAFADSWFGAVELPVQGVLVSFDAGSSWHGLGSDVGSVAVNGRSIELGRVSGAELLDSDGKLRPLVGADKPGTEARVPPRVAREGALGRSPLRTAVLRGVPDGDHAALVVSRGVFARVSLDDGRILASVTRALPENRECSGIRLGKGFGFVCGEPRGKTEIYGYEPPLGLRLHDRFDSPRVVTASDNGAVVVEGRCNPSPVAARYFDYHCVLPPAGERYEISVPDTAGLLRVIGLSDGRAAAIEPPRPERRGSLRLFDASGRLQKKVELRWTREASSTALEAGYWTQGFVESKPGVLSGWAINRGSFLGLKLELDGKVSTGPRQRSIESALLSGSRAIVIGVSGLAEQTRDAGFNWVDAHIPASVDGDGEKTDARPPVESEQGCSLVGCVFRGWIRVGWDERGGRHDSPRPPPPTVLPSPGGGRWRLSCSATGEASRPSLPLTGRKSRVTAEVTAGWLPLLDAAAPALGADRVGLDVGAEADTVQLRAYLSGSKGADFPKNGSLVVRVADRFQIQGAVWSSSPSASPWSDLEQALDAFGFEGNSPSGFRATLDPGGRAGILSVTSRGTTDLYAVEQERPLRRWQNVGRFGLGVVASAVRLDATYYVLTVADSRRYRVFALEASEPRLVGEYEDVPFGGSGPPTLVRARNATATAAALGLWARSGAWYVFPIDERSGEAAQPIEVSARTLSRLPRRCAGDEDGYLLEGAVGLEPNVEIAGEKNNERARVRAVEGRFIVGPDDVCVVELTAQSDRPVKGTFDRALPNDRGLVPLVLNDRGELGRRHAFQCATSK